MWRNNRAPERDFRESLDCVLCAGQEQNWLGVRVIRMGDLEDDVLDGMLSLSLTAAHGDPKVGPSKTAVLLSTAITLRSQVGIPWSGACLPFLRSRLVACVRKIS